MSDWMYKFTRFWANQLIRIKAIAERKAKQNAARDLAANHHKPHQKEQDHER